MQMLRSKQDNSIALIAGGALIAITLTFIFCVLIAALVHCGSMNPAKVKLFCAVTQGVALVIGLIYTGRSAIDRVGMKLLLVAAIYIILFVCIKFILPERYSNNHFIGNWISIISGFVLACALCIPKKKIKLSKKAAFVNVHKKYRQK